MYTYNRECPQHYRYNTHFLLPAAAASVNMLEITADSLAAFHPSMDANFPFDTPLIVQALDSSGNIITDGPDANLVSRQI